MASRLCARIEALERATSAVAPRINVKILGDETKSLRGYRIGMWPAAREVLREPGESDAELLRRSLAALDDNAEEGIVRVVEELRGP